MSFNSLSARASCVLPLLSLFLSILTKNNARRSEGTFLFPEAECGCVIIPDFLGRLGLVTCVSCSQGLLFLRGSAVPQECGCHGALCSRVWGGVWNTPGPGYEVPRALICPEKLLWVGGSALMFSARWLPSPSGGGAVRSCCPVGNQDLISPGTQTLLYSQGANGSLCWSSLSVVVVIFFLF